MEKTPALLLREQSIDLIAIVKDSERCRQLERNLTINKIIENAIPINVLMKTIDSREIYIALDIQLTKLVKSLNLKWNLQDGQIKTIVEDLIDKYPNETLEDFILVFRRARMGGFKDEDGKTTIFRLDSAVIFGWMEIYLGEKYDALEAKLKAEKDDQYKRVKTEDIRAEKHQAWLDKLKEACGVKDIVNKVPTLPADIILSEGQEKPKPKPFINDIDYLEKREMKDKIQSISLKYYGHLKSFSEFKLYEVSGFQIFAESKEKAEEIYTLAMSQK